MTIDSALKRVLESWPMECGGRSTRKAAIAYVRVFQILNSLGLALE